MKAGSLLIVVIFSKIVYFVVILTVCLLLLRIFGVEVASIIAIVSAIWLAIGLSLQGTFSDIASGVLLALFQTYNIGDIIKVEDIEGKVIEFRLVNTLLEDINTGVVVTVPNRKIQDSIIKNYSHNGYHKIAIDVLLSNKNTNFQMIIDALFNDLKDPDKFPDVLRTIPSDVGIYEMGDVGTKLRVRVPVSVDNIVVKRNRIRTRIRNVLADNKVILVDPF